MSNPLLEHIAEKTFSVTEYLDLVNELLGPLHVSVEGEVTDLKVLPQWVFFSLKDAEDGTVLRCGLHSGVYRRLGVNMEEGMMVKVAGYGKLSPKTGNFGFWVSKIEPVGEGALKRAYELLLEKLKKEGLFERKRDIPQFISHIGVISSKNGVVVQDLMENLEPLGIRVDFVHSGVEGADSALEIERAIRYFNKKDDKPQVLVLIRGGGSLESLQGFNNEAVVRALYASPIPVLVGIGHDVDAPIATLVADWSASTPTAVAHVINDSWAPLTERVPVLASKVLQSFERELQALSHKVAFATRGIQHGMKQIFVRFGRYEQSLIRAKERTQVILRRHREEADRTMKRVCERVKLALENSRQRTVAYERLITMSDPARILTRGYGVVYNASGKVVKGVGDIQEGEMVTTRVADGTFDAQVITKHSRD